MFSRKKDVKPKQSTSRSRGSDLSQYGLFDVSNFDDLNATGGNMSDDEDDEEIEAELQAMMGNSKPNKQRHRPKATPLPLDQLNELVSKSLKDTDSGDDDSLDDNDPELLAELSEIQGESKEEDAEPVSEVNNPNLETLLVERLNLYIQAESNAKNSNEISRARRFNRGVKTLNEMLNTVRRGGTVNEADIPPTVSITASKSIAPPSPSVPPTAPVETPDDQPSESVPSIPVTDPESSVPEISEKPPETCSPEILTALTERQNEYKKAAVLLKRSGDTSTALNYIKIVKQFDIVIQGAKEGKPIDLSEMPDTPPEIVSSAASSVCPPDRPPLQTNEVQKSCESDEPQNNAGAPQIVVESSEPPAILAPTTALEALEQRLAVYIKSEEAAKEENNSSKIRRMGRIVKQYKDAIKAHKSGRAIPYDELPTPPGFPPIPGAPQPTETPGESSVMLGPGDSSQHPSRNVSPQPSPQPSPTPSKRLQEDKLPSEPSPKVNVRKVPGSRQEKQLAVLLERQKLFKLAALEAKKNGDLDQAKEHLRNVKGLQPLIEASNCGLPIDMNTVPLPPNQQEEIEVGFDIVSVADSLTGSNDEIFAKLQEDLKEQMKMCMRTRDHYKAVGDVGNANRFEQWALHSKKDLDVVRACEKRDTLPEFHYETRTFSIIQCNTDLTDNDLELTVVRGVNYSVPKPKEVDTYVKIEFPYPTEEPVKKKTSVIYNTNNPQYDAIFSIPIQRNVRAFQRVIKRHAVKCEVYSRGGFLFGLGGTDTLIGTAQVKLQPLESKCTLHEAFDLMNGRKAVGGKLEVKIRIRNPIVTKQLEQVQEKWLVIHK